MVHSALSDSVKFTRSVTDDQGWSVVSFCLYETFYSLVRVSAQSDLCYVYVAIAHSDLSKALLAYFFTSSSELTNFTDVGSLGSLSTCVGVHLCIEYHYVYVLAGSKYMVKSAETDIVCPSVTTEDPDGFLGEILFLLKNFCSIRTSGSSSFLQLCDQDFCISHVLSGVLFCLHELVKCSFELVSCFIGSSHLL